MNEIYYCQVVFFLSTDKQTHVKVMVLINGNSHHTADSERGGGEGALRLGAKKAVCLSMHEDMSAINFRSFPLIRFQFNEISSMLTRSFATVYERNFHALAEAREQYSKTVSASHS
jgi:hypothetical protein